MAYTPSEFAAQIKAKYPDYKSWDDSYLVDQIVKKYPEYKSWVSFAPEPLPGPLGEAGRKGPGVGYDPSTTTPGDEWMAGYSNLPGTVNSLWTASGKGMDAITNFVKEEGPYDPIGVAAKAASDQAHPERPYERQAASNLELQPQGDVTAPDIGEQFTSAYPQVGETLGKGMLAPFGGTPPDGVAQDIGTPTAKFLIDTVKDPLIYAAIHKAAVPIQKGVQFYFGANASVGAIASMGNAYDLYKRGDPHGALRSLVEGGLDATMAATMISQFGRGWSLKEILTRAGGGETPSAADGPVANPQIQPPPPPPAPSPGWQVQTKEGKITSDPAIKGQLMMPFEGPPDTALQGPEIRPEGPSRPIEDQFRARRSIEDQYAAVKRERKGNSIEDQLAEVRKDRKRSAFTIRDIAELAGKEPGQAEALAGPEGWEKEFALTREKGKPLRVTNGESGAVSEARVKEPPFDFNELRGLDPQFQHPPDEVLSPPPTEAPPALDVEGAAKAKAAAEVPFQTEDTKMEALWTRLQQGEKEGTLSAYDKRRWDIIRGVGEGYGLHNSRTNALGMVDAQEKAGQLSQARFGEGGRGVESWQNRNRNVDFQIAAYKEQLRKGGPKLLQESIEYLYQLEEKYPDIPAEFFDKTHKELVAAYMSNPQRGAVNFGNYGKNREPTKATTRQFGDDFFDIRRNWLLHVTSAMKQVADGYLVGEAPIHAAVSAGIDRGLAKISNRPVERFFDEAPAQVRGYWSSFPQAAQIAGQVFGEKLLSHPLDHPRPPRSTSKVTRVLALNYMGERPIAMIDSFMKHMMAEGTWNKLAVREAGLRKLTGANKELFVQNFIKLPFDALLKETQGEILRQMHEATMTSDLKGWAKRINAIRSGEHGAVGGFIGRLLFPFFQISWNQPKAIYQRTPFYLGNIIKQVATGELKGGRISDELAKPIMGMVLVAPLLMAFAKDWLTAGGPVNPSKRYNKEETGWLPNAIHAGKSYLQIQGTGVLGGLATLVAGIAEARTEKDAKVARVKFFRALVDSLEPRTLQDIANYLKILEPGEGDWDKKWNRSLGNFASSLFVPRVVSHLAGALDSDESGRERARKVESWSDYIMRDIPGMREKLPVLRGTTGEPITRDAGAFERFVSPLPRGKERAAPVQRELDRINWLPKGSQKTIDIPTEVGDVKIDLSLEDQNTLLDANSEAVQAVQDTISDPGFKELPMGLKRIVLKRIFAAYRKGALGNLKAKGVEEAQRKIDEEDLPEEDYKLGKDVVNPLPASSVESAPGPNDRFVDRTVMRGLKNVDLKLKPETDLDAGVLKTLNTVFEDLKLAVIKAITKTNPSANDENNAQTEANLKQSKLAGYTKEYTSILGMHRDASLGDTNRVFIRRGSHDDDFDKANSVYDTLLHELIHADPEAKHISGGAEGYFQARLESAKADPGVQAVMKHYLENLPPDYFLKFQNALVEGEQNRAREPQAARTKAQKGR